MIITEYGFATLKDLLKLRKSLSENEIFTLISPLIEELLFLRKNSNICHRNLNLDNIILNKSANNEVFAKIIDISSGYCGLFHENETLLKGANISSITAGFSAPEAFFLLNFEGDLANFQDFDVFKLDVFSLGLVILILMGVSGEKIEKNEVFSNSNEFKEKYPDFYEIISKMISKNPRERSNLEEIAQEFEKRNFMKENIKEFEVLIDRNQKKSLNLKDYERIIDFFEKSFKNPEICSKYCEIAIEFLNLKTKNIRKRLEISLIFAKMLIETGDLDKSLKILESIEKTPEISFLPQIFKTFGLLYYSKGEYQHSIAFYQKAINITPLPANLIDLFIEISHVFRENKEDKKALEFLEKALELNLQINSENHNKTANIYSYKALIFKEKRDFLKAKEFYEKILGIHRVLNEKSIEMCEVLNSLALISKSLGETNQALNYQEKALKLKIELFGEKSIEVANCYNNLGNLYKEMQSYKKALAFHQKALDIKHGILGENDLKIAISLNNLGNIYNILKDFDKALDFHEKAYKIRKSILGSKDLLVAISLNNIGDVYRESMAYDKALELHLKALEIRKEKDDKGYNIALSNYNVGLCYIGLEKDFRAIDYLKIATEEFKKITGELSEEYMRAYRKLGECYNKIGDEQNYRKSIVLLKQKTIEIMKK